MRRQWWDPETRSGGLRRLGLLIIPFRGIPPSGQSAISQQSA